MVDSQGESVDTRPDRIGESCFRWGHPQPDGPVNVIMPDGSTRKSVDCDLEFMELLKVAQHSRNAADFLERIRLRCEW